MNIMEIIYGPRRSGKTTRLVLISCASRKPILVTSEFQKEKIKDIASKMHILEYLPEPINVSMENMKGLGSKRFLVDNAEIMLQVLLGVEVDVITISDYSDGEPQ